MTEMAGIETTGTTGTRVTYQGVIAIEWPQPRPGYECAPMSGWKVAVFDALSGKPITTVTRLVIHVAAKDIVTADVTMFADEAGQPIYTGRACERDGETILGTFPFLVAEIRPARVEPGRAPLEPPLPGTLRKLTTGCPLQSRQRCCGASWRSAPVSGSR